MANIVALSAWGFKLDSLKNEWTKVDKSLLNREIFLSLKKGDEIEITRTNDKGFVLEFTKSKKEDVNLPIQIVDEVENVLNKWDKPVIPVPHSETKDMFKFGEYLKKHMDAHNVTVIDEAKQSSLTDTDRKILKGQCLNIVAMTTHANLKNKDARADLIDTAHKLYQELIDSEFEHW